MLCIEMQFVALQTRVLPTSKDNLYCFFHRRQRILLPVT